MTRAFTLIELLVVITIIVILLALLTPALDRAIYQSELAVCGAGQRAIATTVQTYAIGHRRVYPMPSQGRRAEHQPGELGQASVPQHDLRVPLKGYLSAKLFQCPLTGEIDMSIEGSQPNTAVYSPYELWFGMRYTDPNSSGGMVRIGDRFSWNDAGETHTFRLLVSDKNLQLINGSASSAHPDDEAVMFNTVYQDVNAFGLAIAPGLADFDLTLSNWNSRTNPVRGKLDLNFTRDDGSVDRITGITLDDPRLARIPAHTSGAVPEYRIHIPPN